MAVEDDLFIFAEDFSTYHVACFGRFGTVLSPLPGEPNNYL